MTNFPHVKALGLPLSTGHITLHGELSGQWGSWVRASDLEKLLEQAPVVHSHILPSDENRGPAYDAWFLKKYNDDTHTALLVGVKPIERDTAELILRDLLERDSSQLDRPSMREITRRAKALLAELSKDPK